MKRILVIRGGAIGDFILTLPAIKLLRESLPEAHLEILGHKEIIELARDRYYANATRSIDDAPLSRFFVPNSELASDLVEYFASFDLIVSYLFDPDRTFAANLRRCATGELITGSVQLHDHEHATWQLAKPLARLGLRLDISEPVVYPNESDQSAARRLLGSNESSLVAIHPGSGGKVKNWPVEKWIALGDHILSRKTPPASLVVIGGEADEHQTTQLRSVWKKREVRFAISWPLPQLAALLQNGFFVGHDSGISHLAAAAGAECLLLFGPTDPAIWAPTNANVRIIRAPNENLAELDFATVRDAMEQLRYE